MIGSLTPDSASKSLANRAVMAARLPAAAVWREPAMRPLATAMRATAAGRLRPEERAAARRVEAWRRRLVDHPPAPPAKLEVGDLASAVSWMSVPPVLGRFLLRYVRELAPRRLIELGTGFGVSAAYQGAALELAGRGELVTIDVSPVWSQVASAGLRELGLDRVEAVVVTDESAQDELIRSRAPLDYAFVDSDHRESATLRLLERLAPHMSPGAPIVFDDVGFGSREMRHAWARVAAHPLVGRAVGLGRFGVALIDAQP